MRHRPSVCSLTCHGKAPRSEEAKLREAVLAYYDETPGVQVSASWDRTRKQWEIGSALVRVAKAGFLDDTIALLASLRRQGLQVRQAARRRDRAPA